jgi:hypothetical protein
MKGWIDLSRLLLSRDRGGCLALGVLPVWGSVRCPTCYTSAIFKLPNGKVGRMWPFLIFDAAKCAVAECVPVKNGMGGGKHLNS